jgi:hypothetical protein
LQPAVSQAVLLSVLREKISLCGLFTSPGKAKITVKSGKKKVTITVTVKK